MKKATLFLIILWGALGVATASPAQTAPRFDGARNSRGAGSSVVHVYGPAVLTELAGQAILENRHDVVVVQDYKPLKNKVLIEGTTGSGYMPLSPKRVSLLQAAKARGGSVYSALCSEQQGVIRNTVGMNRVAHHVERQEYRAYYVRPVYPPPPVVYAPPVVVGGYYPFYGHGGYGWRGYARYPYYRGRRGYPPFRAAY